MNSLILENVSLVNVPVAVQKAGGGTLLAGAATTISAGDSGPQAHPSRANYNSNSPSLQILVHHRL